MSIYPHHPLLYKHPLAFCLPLYNIALTTAMMVTMMVPVTATSICTVIISSRVALVCWGVPPATRRRVSERSRGRNGDPTRPRSLQRVWTWMIEFIMRKSKQRVSYARMLILDVDRNIRSAMGKRLFFTYIYSLETKGVGHSAVIEFGYHLLRDEHFPCSEASCHDGTDTRVPTIVREGSQTDILLAGKNSPFAIDVESRLPWRSVSMLAHPPGYNARYPQYKLDVDRIVAIEVRGSASVLSLWLTRLT